MFTAVPRRQTVITIDHSDPRYLVRHDARPGSYAVDNDSPKCMPGLDSEGNFQCQVRIVHGFLAVGAAIEHRIAGLSQEILQMLLEEVPTMIRTQHNSLANR